ncbi:serine/threonine-protein kinase pim-2-like, partial [Oratosquilla oratoria]|uniref:serine/threonine-protein kinase pim-2-like n=1 Tax=Oratosquilla oratoria TaxID=337810 RepID=UPI003F772F32
SYDGCVYRAKRVVDGLQVALKQVPLASVKSWGTHQGKSVPKEAALLQRVQQVPGVIKIIDSFSSEDSFYMVMELIPSAMSLYDYIETSNQLPIAQVKRLFTKVVKAIQGCIDVGVSHKDIKPENILIYRDDSSRFDIKVIDFGSGELITSYNGKKTGGTPIYWPPEYINGGKFIHVPATVWSLGTLLYYLVCREDPFNSNASIRRAKPPFPNNVPKLGRDLILRCFKKDPWSRLSLRGILSHPWLTGLPCSPSTTTEDQMDVHIHLHLETAQIFRKKHPKNNRRVNQGQEGCPSKANKKGNPFIQSETLRHQVVIKNVATESKETDAPNALRIPHFLCCVGTPSSRDLP